MEASSLASAGVQPGDTTLIRIQVERLDALRRLRIVEAIIANIEAGILIWDRAESLRRHRAARDRLARELGL
jgi:hypothetical protein